MTLRGNLRMSLRPRLKTHLRTHLRTLPHKTKIRRSPRVRRKIPSRSSR
jgi:hypothetical protein